MTLRAYQYVDGEIRLTHGIPDVTPPVLPSPTIYAGALPPGIAVYPIPSTGDVRYVSPSGSNANDGASTTTPWLTVQHAINNTANGGTIILRSGNYFESLTTPHMKTLRIQSYPGEFGWLDGSKVYSSWTNNGDGTWTTAYTITHARFDMSGFGGSYAQRNHPDQVWVDGSALWQVADGATPSAGQFSVDQTADTLTIGVNPTGKEVRIAEKVNALIASGRLDMYGIGIRRYSPNTVKGFNGLIYGGGSSDGTILENCHFRESAVAGIEYIRPGLQVRSCTIQDVGWTGINLTNTDNLLIEKCLIRRGNLCMWDGAPATSGIKVVRSDSPTIRWNYLEDFPNAGAIWYDVSNIRSKMYGNYIDGRSKGRGAMATMLFQEISDGGFVDGVQHKNYIVGNYTIGGRGSSNVQSSHSEWWNNTFEANTEAGLLLDADRAENSGSPAANRTHEVCPWAVNDVRIMNNRFGVPASGGSYPIRLRARDSIAGTKRWLGWGMIARLSGNAFLGGNPPHHVQLGDVNGNFTSRNSQAELAASSAAIGGPPGAKLGTNHWVTEPTPEQVDAVAEAIPEQVASLLGVEVGSKSIGHNPDNIPTPMPDTGIPA